ncbi:MAG: hypothetical protein OQK55_03385 [Thermoanaerobaculales bacterium]|nr:hypothetical protein [Thermoanaerobaculales bacterium]
MKKPIFLLMALIIVSSIASAQQIYMTGTRGNQVWVANRDGSGSPSVLFSDAVTSTQGPAGMIAVLGTVNQLFYGGGNYNDIFTANVDGSGAPAILWDDGCCEHLGITADPATGMLYWSTETDIIRSGAWDGTGGITDVFTGLTGGTVGITLDAASGTLYWTSVDSDSIFSGASDGSTGPNLLYDNATDGVLGPRQIVYSGGMLYWTEHDGPGGGGVVVSAPASGAGPRTILHTVPVPFLPYGIDIDGSTLVWTEFEPLVTPYNDRVMTGAANGSGTPAVLFAGDFGQIRGIAAGANIFFGAAPLLVAVPELSPWSVTILIVLLATCGLVVLRRIGTV